MFSKSYSKINDFVDNLFFSTGVELLTSKSLANSLLPLRHGQVPVLVDIHPVKRIISWHLKWQDMTDLLNIVLK